MNFTTNALNGVALFVLFFLFSDCRPSNSKKETSGPVSIAAIENEYYTLGNFDSAFALATDAARFYHQKKEYTNEATALLWMAAGKLMQPDYTAAKDYLNRAGSLIGGLKNDSLSTEYYLAKAELFSAEIRPDSAQQCFLQAEKYIGAHQPESPFLKARLALSRSALCERLHQTKKADSLTRQAVHALADRQDRNGHYYYALALVNRVYFINENSGPDSALYLSDKLTGLVNHQFPRNDYLHALLYRSLANSGMNNMDYDASLAYAKKELVYAHASKTNPALFYAYYDMQQAQEYNQDFRQEQLFVDSMDDIRKITFPEKSSQAVMVSSSYGRIFTNTHDYDKAKYYLQKSIGIDSIIFGKSSEELSGAYANMGNLYSYREQYDSVLYYNWKVLAIRKMIYPGDHISIAFCLDDIARTYNNLDQPAKALPYQQTIEKIYRKTYGPTHSYMAWAYDAEADSYGQLKQYDKAIRYSDMALGLFIPDMEKDTNAIDHTEAIPFDIYLPDYLTSRIAIFYDRSLYSNDKEQKIRFLKKADQVCIATNRYIQSYTSHFDSPESVSAVYQRMYDYYKLAADISYDLYQLTGEEEYRNGILNYSENKRGAFLRSNILNSRSIKFSGVPDAVIREEARMRSAVTAITDKSTPDHQKDSVNKAYEQFLHHLSTLYPDYYRLKYLPYTLKEKEVQQWLPDDSTVFAEYMIGRKRIYILVISKRSCSVVSLEKKDSILAQITGLGELLRKADSKAYYARSYAIYHYLVQPLEQYIRTGSKVIISADGALSTLSFEALVNKANPADPGFNAKDFLFNKYNFSYAVSAFSLLNPFNKGGAAKTKDKAYFSAPGFEHGLKTEYKQFAASHHLPVDNDYLSYLYQPFMMKLGDALSASWNVTREEGRDATESDFKQKAPGNNIVQVGSHALLNNMDPMRSCLIFAKELSTDSAANDGYLYSSEIYNQRLNADLVILTACETGGGKYKQGEGMMSLSYSFEYAGCKSAIMSLWPIDEKTASVITERFYKHLSSGESTAHALYHAKKDFLETADASQVNPFYWSGLVLLGPDEKIQLQKNNHPYRYAWLIGTLCMAGIGGWRIKKWKDKRSV